MRGEAASSRPAADTRHSRPRFQPLGLSWAYALDSMRRGSTQHTRACGRVGAALGPQAITSGQNKKPMPTTIPFRASHWHRLITKHWPNSIFTMWVALQVGHQSWRFLASVSGLATWDVGCLHIGQTYRPFLTLSLLFFCSVCKPFAPLSMYSYRLLTLVSRLKIIKAYSRFRRPWL